MVQQGLWESQGIQHSCWAQVPVSVFDSLLSVCPWPRCLDSVVGVRLHDATNSHAHRMCSRGGV